MVCTLHRASYFILQRVCVATDAESYEYDKKGAWCRLIIHVSVNTTGGGLIIHGSVILQRVIIHVNVILQGVIIHVVSVILHGVIIHGSVNTTRGNYTWKCSNNNNDNNNVFL